MNEEQKAKLIELLEEYADDHAYNYYTEDQGYGSEVGRAKKRVEKSKAALYDYINLITLP